MPKKPTYEELEQRVRELEKEAVEHRRAEEEVLLHTEIVENMAEGVYLIRTGDGVIVYANKTFERMFGYEPGELVNKHVSIVNAPSEKSPEEIANDIIQSLKEKGTWSGEVHNIKKDGTPFWCHANVSTFDHHDFGEVWVSVHQDIGKRKKVEEQLKKYHDYLEELVKERTAELAKANEQLKQEIEERKPIEEALQKRTHDLGERVKELNCLYGISNLVEKQGISLEEIFQGTADLIPHSWQHPEITCARIVLEGREFRTKNYQDSIWMHASDILVHDERIGTLEVCYLEEKPESDEGSFLKEETNLINAIAERLARIFERKQAEEALRDAQEKLIRKEKLATIGELSGGIAHELRNPLGVIDSSAYYLKKRLKEADDKVQEHLDRIKAQVGRATAIIESLLNLTRIKEPRLETLDLKAITSEGIATSKLPDTVNVVRNFPEEEVLVSADREQLSLALRNIVANAVEAMTGEGTLTVTVCRASDDRAELSFIDTGPGIDPENLDRIFEPLFTTRAKGIGFGLSIARMVIGRHGGTIEARSEPGRGATIIVRLPLYVDRGKEE